MAAANNKLIDNYGRQVIYLRVSVTQKCNLNCFYCRPEECEAESGKDSLGAEEYYNIVKSAAEMGIYKVRLTGGEPLLRPDIIPIISSLSSIPQLKDLSLTTNGILLENRAFELASAGLNRVNISMDSLDEANFHQITNGGKLKNALGGIENSLKASLTPVKINAVLLKGINDHEIHDFLKLTLEQELDVRFIEYMPASQEESRWSKHFISLDKVKEIAGTIAPLIPIEGDHGGGPAEYYRFERAKGRIGLISPLSRHFCDRCNRMRITSDGKIKPCLFSQEEVDLNPHLSQGDKIKQKLVEALQIKPDPGKAALGACDRMKQFRGKRSMLEIGG